MVSGTPSEADQGSTWGQSPDMNALEAIFWRAEIDPRLRSTITAVEVLDTTPDWERFRDAHDWGSRMVPRFRQHVTELPFGLGTPAWTTDPDFDLDYHVRRVRLPDGAGYPDLFAVAQRMAMAAFDRARAPWEAALIEGLPEGRAGYVLKMHHSATDGIGGMQLFSELHSRKREPWSDKPQPAAPEPESTSLMDAVRHQVSRDVRSIAGGLAAGGENAVRALGRPDRAVRDAARYASSLRRVMGDPGAEGSPLLANRSLSWRFGALDVGFADLRAAGKTVGASINDVYLAALLGGFRLYHERMGRRVDRLPMGIPISVRKEGDAAGGNRIASARLAGPVGIADPEERIADVRAQVRGFREEPAMTGMVAVAPVMARLPGRAISQIAGPLTRGNDLQASNVPGLREDVYVAGAKVERMYPYAPLPGCATMITLITHGELGCVGVNMDAAAVTEPDLFGGCLAEGFDEVLALGGSAEPAVWRT